MRDMAFLLEDGRRIAFRGRELDTQDWELRAVITSAAPRNAQTAPKR